jgi:hypothetical protein
LKRKLKKRISCFDKTGLELVEGLSTNGKSSTLSTFDPFALSVPIG